MLTFTDVARPGTLEEAYQTLTAAPNNHVLGGCAFLRLGSMKIGTAIDLSKLELDQIVEYETELAIGAMTTFREIETSRVLNSYFNGVLGQAVSNVVGVQFRNIVTAGATVYSKYGFSDLITPLLALDTEVELYKQGRIPLASFLEKPAAKDILVGLWIKREQRKASYQHMRVSAADFPVLNAAASRLNNAWTIVVGARPLRAAVAEKASAKLSQGNVNETAIAEAAKIATEELSFGSNMRGSAEYRRILCEVLVKRAVQGVLQCS